MTTTQNIHIEEYDYSLPDDKIAKYPLSQRDSSKLLICKDKQLTEGVFSHLGESLPNDALLVFNNTKVIQARIIFQKETGAQIEIFCLEPKIPADYAQVFAQNEECTWLCMVGNAKRWKDGKLKKQIQIGENIPDFELTVERLESYGETHLVRFSWDNQSVSFAEILEACGELPIPPYLNRKTEVQDKETYQTVYSKTKGSVAAPTAGLHFTKEVFDSLSNKNIDIEELTLHVGAGTFKPVKSETIAEHVMHAECFSVKKSTIEQLLSKKGKVIAVGTTSVRSLESLYYIGVLLEKDAGIQEFNVTQWMPYNEENNLVSTEKSLRNILNHLEQNKSQALTAHTQIIIAPGYEFKFVNGIITNFHQPKSTLLLLISAFLEGNWKSVYDYALMHDFRFLSYGDSSLLLK